MTPIVSPTLAVMIFSFLYRFTRQTFIPFAKTIDLPLFHDNSYFFSADNISSIFALLYALLQIPYGILMDKYNIYKILTYLSIIMASGLWITALATNTIMFALGRWITIIGAAGAFIGTVKIMGQKYGRSRGKTMVGRIIATTVMGSLFFLKIIVPRLLIVHESWRGFYGIQGLFMSAISIYFFYYRPEPSPYGHQRSPSFNIQQLIGLILKNRSLILIILLAFFFFMIYYCVAETQYITNLLWIQLSLTPSNTSSLLLTGYLIGFLTVPILYKYIGHIKLLIITTMALISLSISMIYSINMICSIVFLLTVGFSNGFQILILDMTDKETPIEYTATMASLLNVLFVGGAFIPQQILFRIVPIWPMGSMIIFYGIIGISCLVIGIGLSLLYHKTQDYNNSRMA